MNMPMPMHQPNPAFSLTLVVSLAALPAFGQDGSKAAAEALFEQGRALLEQGNHAEACPKLAESQRIDPATGTLLALALCHEGEGKLASAWAEFKQVEGQARSAGRTDRETLARERSAALRPRLSTLTVWVSPNAATLPGFELRVDGARCGPARFGVAVPIDGGHHQVEAVAPGKKRWQASIFVKNEADRVEVSVPSLEPAPIPKNAPPAPPVSAPADAGSAQSTLRTSGYVAAGAGLLAMGAGSYLAMDAKRDYDAARRKCDPTGCADEAYQAGEDARTQGNLATVLFVLGGAAVATGAVLWVLTPTDQEGRTDLGLRPPRIGVGAQGLLVEGSF